MTEGFATLQQVSESPGDPQRSKTVPIGLHVSEHPDSLAATKCSPLCQQVSESRGDPKTGPIGLQAHDQSTFIMFRNIRIRPR